MNTLNTVFSLVYVHFDMVFSFVYVHFDMVFSFVYEHFEYGVLVCICTI